MCVATLTVEPGDAAFAPLTPDQVLVQRLSQGLAVRRRQHDITANLSVIPIAHWGEPDAAAAQFERVSRCPIWLEHDTKQSNARCFWRSSPPAADEEEEDDD